MLSLGAQRLQQQWRATINRYFAYWFWAARKPRIRRLSCHVWPEAGALLIAAVSNKPNNERIRTLSIMNGSRLNAARFFRVQTRNQGSGPASDRATSRNARIAFDR